VEKEEVTARLAGYVEEARSGPIVVTMGGRPIAFLATVKGSDLEDLSIGTDPGFLEILSRSRESHKGRGGVSMERLRRQLPGTGKKDRRRRDTR
jgi:antitoxin (DNA-binding transcriptional repressor) of toxin-antitoxin stability system